MKHVVNHLSPASLLGPPNYNATTSSLLSALGATRTTAAQYGTSGGRQCHSSQVTIHRTTLAPIANTDLSGFTCMTTSHIYQMPTGCMSPIKRMVTQTFSLPKTSLADTQARTSSSKSGCRSTNSNHEKTAISKLLSTMDMGEQHL